MYNTTHSNFSCGLVISNLFLQQVVYRRTLHAVLRNTFPRKSLISFLFTEIRIKYPLFLEPLNKILN